MNFSLVLGAKSQTPCFGPSVEYDVFASSSSIATGDLDGDGDLDVAVTKPSLPFVTVFSNQGDGQLGSPQNHAVSANPNRVAVADLDGDGRQDLVVTSSATPPSGQLQVLRNLGNGTFAAPVSYPASINPRSVAVADLDGDGDADVVVANDSNLARVSVFLNAGNGALAAAVQYPTGRHPQGLAVLDLDGDGDLDLATPNAADDNVTILLNQGNATFAPPVAYAAGVFPHAIGSADFDGDGDLDLAVISVTSHELSVYLNTGNGTFAPRVVYGTELYAAEIALADFDLDGDVDVALGNMADGIRLNLGNGTFGAPINPPSSPSLLTMATADLDGDGDKDLLGANSISIAVQRNCTTSGVSTCVGNGVSPVCPCANDSPLGSVAGCLNSAGSGATLRASGSASLVQDGLVLEVVGMPPTAPALFHQGTTAHLGGSGTPFGDGLACASGTITRLSVKISAGGASAYPVTGEPSLSVHGFVTTPGERVYQVLYRDGVNFCSSATFNFSNGLRVHWTP